MYKLVLLPLFTLIAGLLSSGSIPPLESSRSGIHSYPEHLTGAFTGGFGEETCHSCHFDYELNPKDGSLLVSGLPTTIKAGQTLNIAITVSRKELGKAGFQLSARDPGGRQTGRFEIEDNSRVMATKSVPATLQYVQHSKEGTEPSEQGATNWKITWKAPDTLADTVFFNISANAANGDQSEFGDFIYAKEIKVTPEVSSK